jgi:hypothetical protein
VKYAFMRANREQFDIKRMCEVLKVSRSGYYDWAGRDESKRSQQDRVLFKEIRKIHQEAKEAYGATKTWRTLKQSAMVCGNAVLPCTAHAFFRFILPFVPLVFFPRGRF